MKITKTVIPAAGLGTRFLPLTKTLPKEMLPLLSKPAVQYVVEESLQSGIRDIIVVSNKERDVLMNYFDVSLELRVILKDRGKEGLLSELDRIINTARFTYVRQPEPLGLGHAVLMAQGNVETKGHVCIMLPDDIIIGTPPAMQQLMTVAMQERTNVLAVQEVPSECLHLYGVIAIKKQLTPRLFQIAGIVEKPKQEEAPSNLAVVGRYIISTKIFKHLADLGHCAVDEIQLTDALNRMIRGNEKILAYKIQGARYDVGTPVGWLKAQIALGLEDPLYAQALRQFIATLDTPSSFRVNPARPVVHGAQP